MENMRTHRHPGSWLLAAALAFTTFGSIHQVSADDRRENSLAKDVAVRHRRLLVKNRLEVAPLFESTINAPYRAVIGGGLKLEYHLSDKWSIGVVGVASASLNTSLVNKIEGTLVANPTDPREPTETEYEDHLNSMPFHGAAYVSLTPWYGKLAAFSAAYVAFDFYFQAGVAFAMLQSSCPSNVCSDMNPGVGSNADENPNNDPPLNNGGRVGLYLGGGIHVFLNDFLALDLTVRDYAFSDNPSGADYNADLAVTSADNNFLHHLFFGAGLSVMLPTKVKRTP
jgi:outer membrane beta-barrel protein